MKYIDRILNGVTMYHLVLRGLMLIALLATILGFVGVLPYSGIALVSSFFVVTFVSYVSNYLFGLHFRTPLNAESSSITALILFCVCIPASSLHGYIDLALVGFLAMASKYIFAIRKKHIFNPAAIALVAMGLLGSGVAIWWIATPVLFVPVTLLALAVARKLRKSDLFFTAIVTALLVTLFFALQGTDSLTQVVTDLFLSYPLIFFAGIMLTEPLTTPPTRFLRIGYGVLAGFLFAYHFRVGPFVSTPELALILANIFSYFVSPKVKLFAKLTEHRQLSASVHEFVFGLDQPFAFAPGQYIEWTLPHDKTDSRGNRRYFTIASSPTERDLRIGVRIMEKGSSFKKALATLRPGSPIVATGLAGEFTLPRDQREKLVFVAGGIGVTPFRSMIQYLIDKKEKRDIVLFYSAMNADEFAYREIFERAASVGVRVVYLVTNKESIPSGMAARVGYVTGELVRELVPDYIGRTYYLSGPDAMVQNYKKMIRSLGVAPRQIKTDYFPGF